MTWNLDIPSIPRDRRILIETRKGEVMISVFNKPTKGTPAGWFSGVGPVECIVAWQELPAASGGMPRADGGLDIVHKHTEINTPILEDVGGGP
jgi:hypothetical protein